MAIRTYVSGSKEPTLAAFLATLAIDQVTQVRNGTDTTVPPAKKFKTLKAAVNAAALVLEEVEKKGLAYAIAVHEDNSVVVVTGDADGVPPALNVRITRSPAQLAADAEGAKNTTTKAVERVIENPRDPAPGEAKVKRERAEGGAVLRVKFDKNPRRAGSKAAERLGQLRDGMTLDAFVTAVASVGGKIDKKLARRARRLIKKCVAAGQVTMEDPAVARAAAKAK